jgi:ribosome-associated heat shock protein Hsp15
MGNEIRIDKWLWASRLFKTRSIATEACKKGRVTMKGVIMKPSRLIKEGDVIEVRKPPITWSFRVLKAINNRVGPKLVPEILENVTSKEQLELLEMSRLAAANQRARGTGRPTKKERRDIDSYTGDSSLSDWFDDDEDEGADEADTEQDSATD